MSDPQTVQQFADGVVKTVVNLSTTQGINADAIWSIAVSKERAASAVYSIWAFVLTIIVAFLAWVSIPVLIRGKESKLAQRIGASNATEAAWICISVGFCLLLISLLLWSSGIKRIICPEWYAIMSIIEQAKFIR